MLGSVVLVVFIYSGKYIRVGQLDDFHSYISTPSDEMKKLLAHAELGSGDW